MRFCASGSGSNHVKWYLIRCGSEGGLSIRALAARYSVEKPSAAQSNYALVQNAVIVCSPRFAVSPSERRTRRLLDLIFQTPQKHIPGIVRSVMIHFNPKKCPLFPDSVYIRMHSSIFNGIHISFSYSFKALWL